MTFAPVSDARVERANPAANNGTATSLVADLSPNIETYIGFSVAGVTGTVVSAKLRLYTTSGTPNGAPLYGAGSAWTETGITWNTKPARTTGVIDNKAAVAAKAWVEYDVRAVVTADGTYTFTLAPESSNGMAMNSREAASNRPQLVVQFQPG